MRRRFVKIHLGERKTPVDPLSVNCGQSQVKMDMEVTSGGTHERIVRDY